MLWWCCSWHQHHEGIKEKHPLTSEEAFWGRGWGRGSRTGWVSELGGQGQSEDLAWERRQQTATKSFSPPGLWRPTLAYLVLHQWNSWYISKETHWGHQGSTTDKGSIVSLFWEDSRGCPSPKGCSRSSLVLLHHWMLSKLRTGLPKSPITNTDEHSSKWKFRDVCVINILKLKELIKRKDSI